MRPDRIELLAVAGSRQKFPAEHLPEIAFIGRSNVGKSSLINNLLRRKKLAAVSGTPGKTRALFFYRVGALFCLVDLPGYGYARVTRECRQAWAPLIETYLSGRNTLKGCVHLVDVRIDPTAGDLQMRRWLEHHCLKTITVATKTDKVSRGALTGRLNRIAAALDLPPPERPLAYSVLKGTGRNELWVALVALAQQPPDEPNRSGGNINL